MYRGGGGGGGGGGEGGRRVRRGRGEGEETPCTLEIGVLITEVSMALVPD